MIRVEEGDPIPDLDQCAQELINIIGHIQPHGVLFALSEPDFIVQQVSSNVSAVLGMSPEVVLGNSLQTVLGEQQLESLRTRLPSDDPLTENPLRVTVGGAVEMNCVTHRYDGVLIVELELVRGTYSLEPLNLGAHIRIPVSHMEQASDILELARLAAAEIHRLSGFNRVMVYRFDENWNGEVIGEAADPSPVSYLGLRFPATDIPAQARRLFLLNPLRAIADVAATPVAIIPQIGPLTGRALDLTLSLLRSASPIHLEYLRNMSVQSSLTVSIVVEHRLWGMIACHHATPRRLDYTTRSVCKLIGQILGSQVALRIDNAALQSRLASRKLLQEYMAGVEASKSLIDAKHFQNPQLLDLFDADGLVSCIDGVVSSQGTTVEEELLLPVIRNLRSVPSGSIASSNMLSILDRGAASYASQVSGALYLGLTEGTGDYLLLLRRELVETVIWAGNPDKAVSADERGRLRPRASFAAWQETVRGRSRPWNELQLESAGFLREQLLRLREAQKLHKSDERVRYLAHHDTLTGLMNRHSIYLKLEECVKEAAADGSSFNVLFIDLDRFKYFNDSLGHAVGDQILEIVAKRMQRQVRAKDIVGRLGGDEFIIIMQRMHPETEISQAVKRILNSIEEPLGIEHDSPIKLTASIGLSCYPLDGVSSEDLVSRSDTAMYRVKRSGGNAFEVFRPDTNGGDKSAA